jgi:hypothetical protein
LLSDSQQDDSDSENDLQVVSCTLMKRSVAPTSVKTEATSSLVKTEILVKNEVKTEFPVKTEQHSWANAKRTVKSEPLVPGSVCQSVRRPWLVVKHTLEQFFEERQGIPSELNLAVRSKM